MAAAKSTHRSLRSPLFSPKTSTTPQRQQPRPKPPLLAPGNSSSYCRCGEVNASSCENSREELLTATAVLMLFSCKYYPNLRRFFFHIKYWGYILMGSKAMPSAINYCLASSCYSILYFCGQKLVLFLELGFIKS